MMSAKVMSAKVMFAKWALGGLSILAGLAIGYAIITLVASSIGQMPGNPAWTYVLVLLGCLGLAGALGAGRAWVPMGGRGAWAGLTGLAIGAVTGFYYAGAWTGKDSQWAIAGAVVGGGLLGAIAIVGQVARVPQRVRWAIAVCLSLALAFSAYGFGFWVGTVAIALLSVGHWGEGAAIALLSLSYLWLTWRFLWQLVHHLRSPASPIDRSARYR